MHHQTEYNKTEKEKKKTQGKLRALTEGRSKEDARSPSAVVTVLLRLKYASSTKLIEFLSTGWVSGPLRVTITYSCPSCLCSSTAVYPVLTVRTAVYNVLTACMAVYPVLIACKAVCPVLIVRTAILS